MSESPLVSVIIPTYGRSESLLNSIDSVMTQSYKDIELIVIDDNNSDSEYFKYNYNGLLQSYPNIIYIAQGKNVGAARARNNAVKVSNGSMIAFLDDDDIWLPDKLKLQIELFNHSSVTNIGMIYCFTSIFDSNRNKIKEIHNEYKGNPVLVQFFKNITSTSTMLLPKNVFLEVGGFPLLKSGQDYIFLLNLLEAGYNIDYVAKPLIEQYYHNDERISNSYNSLLGTFETMQVIESKISILPMGKRRKLKRQLNFRLLYKAIYFDDRKFKSIAIKKSINNFIFEVLLIYTVIYLPIKFFGGKMVIEFLQSIKYRITR
ncbi:glycosyltransferase family 2 protein [Candidatus Xianfuyuplasma coldseepsis]|uniref:Glycosyltransferase family 2 protein n=1 Tax=Candidatus Xianfuyuplasma coldseepsis TaxID=2782163 RepID=A0A7L7KP23_9MOLU|nr:glycosyltransferase family 2 protein [Xianfuyuplasma coldseepsis]QMS84530.1 glycosyltransferase family 2 protein [Xianfuyuplasma coldseepsis]